MPPGAEFPFFRQVRTGHTAQGEADHVQTFPLWRSRQWVRKCARRRTARIEVSDAGTPQAAVKTDEPGNGIGGVRSVYMDVPTATFIPISTGPGNCREMGHKTDFDAARIQTLYGGQQKYAAKVAQSADKLVKDRWLTEADEKKIKQELAAR